MSLRVRFIAFTLIVLAASTFVFADEDDFVTQMMRATVKISHPKSTATGFILTVGEEETSVLVTAAHVLDTIPADECSVIFRTRESEGVYHKTPLKLKIRNEGKPLYVKHPTEDVVAIRIVPPPGVDLPKLPSSVLASDELIRKNKVHPGEELDCLGYPHRNESNSAGFPILRLGTISTYPLVPAQSNKTFLVAANTFEGDSGGPVILYRQPADGRKKATSLIMGLVSAQMFLDEEARMIYGTTKIRHRLGLAIVVQATFIRQTIDRLPAADTPAAKDVKEATETKKPVEQESK